MAKEKADNRFEVVRAEKVSLIRDATILRDKQTGVLYLLATQGYGGGLTPLLDKDGNPIIDNGAAQ